MARTLFLFITLDDNIEQAYDLVRAIICKWLVGNREIEN